MTCDEASTHHDGSTNKTCAKHKPFFCIVDDVASNPDCVRLQLVSRAHAGDHCDQRDDGESAHRSNEKKISDGYRKRAPIEVEVY